MVESTLIAIVVPPTAVPTGHSMCGDPSADPTANPSTDTSDDPSADPTANPGTDLSDNPSADPAATPSTDPSDYPSADPATDCSADRFQTERGGRGTHLFIYSCVYVWGIHVYTHMLVC